MTQALTDGGYAIALVRELHEIVDSAILDRTGAEETLDAIQAAMVKFGLKLSVYEDF